MKAYRCFVALGDSVTEGIGDTVPGYPDLGTHDQLAGRLQGLYPDMQYVNLARRGLLSHEILTGQLEQASALNPDLVSVIAGANDLLKMKWNPGQFAADYRQLLSAFPDATLVTMTLPNFSLRFGKPPALIQRFERQWEQANTIIREVAGEEGALLLDVTRSPLHTDPAYWSADAVHPNRRGYALIAAELGELLGLPPQA